MAFRHLESSLYRLQLRSILRWRGGK
jgi:hypothetical protein